jgi:hypothetical protein
MSRQREGELKRRKCRGGVTQKKRAEATPVVCFWGCLGAAGYHVSGGTGRQLARRLRHPEALVLSSRPITSESERRPDQVRRSAVRVIPGSALSKAPHVGAFVFRSTCGVGSVRWAWSRLWSFRVQNSVASGRANGRVRAESHCCRAIDQFSKRDRCRSPDQALAHLATRAPTMSAEIAPLRPRFRFARWVR